MTTKPKPIGKEMSWFAMVDCTTQENAIHIARELKKDYGWTFIVRRLPALNPKPRPSKRRKA